MLLFSLVSTKIAIYQQNVDFTVRSAENFENQTYRGIFLGLVAHAMAEKFLPKVEEICLCMAFAMPKKFRQYRRFCRKKPCESDFRSQVRLNPTARPNVEIIVGGFRLGNLPEGVVGLSDWPTVPLRSSRTAGPDWQSESPVCRIRVSDLPVRLP